MVQRAGRAAIRRYGQPCIGGTGYTIKQNFEGQRRECSGSLCCFFRGDAVFGFQDTQDTQDAQEEKVGILGILEIPRYYVVFWSMYYNSVTA